MKSAPDLKYLANWAKTQDAACVLVDKKEGFVKIASKTHEKPLPLPESRTGNGALKH